MIRSIIGIVIGLALIYIGWHVWKRMSPEARQEVSGLAKEEGKSLLKKVVEKGRDLKGTKAGTGGLKSLFSLKKEIVNEKDGAEMVLVEAGEFVMGSEESAAIGNPQKKASSPAFYVDRYEVTNAQWKRFVDEAKFQWKGSWVKPVTTGWVFKKTTFQPATSYPEALSQFPVVEVSLDDARAYAEWAGKRLPTEQEWEKAARGSEGRAFPWGNEWKPSLCNLAVTDDRFLLTAPVGSFADGISPYGAGNMAGNVAEWTTGATGAVIRGGSWKDGQPQARCTHRAVAPPSGVRFRHVGFR